MSGDGSSAAIELTRSSGVLLHPTSLPGGRLGADAERFVDWLAAAGQSWWQILPLVPPDRYGSPYTSTSAFAGWRGLLAEPKAEVSLEELERFREQHRYWIGDWERFAGAEAAADQVRFDREWSALRRYAAARGVRIIGDLPIYVASASADVLAHPELFDTSELAGAPPDSLSPRGQLWGNPLYRWTASRAEGHRWWIERFRRTFELVDMTRVDHLRGFVAYWAVRPGEPTAEHGRWRPGPGYRFFEAVERELGRLPLIVEDLGVITPPVHRLRESLGAPGMRVLQFAFNSSRLNVHALANQPEDSVVYTSTHDLDPVAAWWGDAPEADRRRAAAQMAAAGIDEPDPVWGLIRLAFTSRARLAVVQAQDVLGLGSEARLNTPGTTSGNWRWRLAPGQLTDELAERLRRATEETGRLAIP
jgi:4-alpha-glucanotransferase